MKSKFVFGLVAMTAILAFATSSFAQINIQVFPQTSAQEIQTNRDAQTGDPTSTGSGILVSGAVIASAPLTTTSLTIDYPGVLTSSGPCIRRGAAPNRAPFGLADGSGGTLDANGNACPPIPAGDPLRIEGATGLFAGATISSINYTNATVEITLPGTLGSGGVVGGVLIDAPANSSGSFRLVGARLDMNGQTAPIVAAFSLSSTSNNYILSTTSGTVINAVGAGIASVVVGTRSSTTTSVGSGITIFTNRTIGGGNANCATSCVSFTLAEGFASAWRSQAQETSDPATRTTPNGTNIRLTFTGLQFTGTTNQYTLTLSTSSASSLGVLINGGATATVSGTSPTATISFTSSSLTSVESLQINAALTAAPINGGSLTAGPIQVTATLVPIGDALGGNLQPNIGTGYPNFAQADSTPLTIGSVIAPTTILLIPYAVQSLGFDTGIAVSNTTADPFGGLANGGATAGSGPVSLSLYGRTATGATPTAVTINTSATVRPGAGLDASGNLNSGSTWTVLLSELRTSAGQTGDFTGYIFIQAPFLDGHGASFISDFRSFTSASPVLVLTPTSNGGGNRSNPTGGVETLGN